MKSITKYILTILALTTIVSGNVFGQIRVFAQVDTSKDIYVGENFVYNIIIDGDNKPGQVNLTALAKYNPQSAGNRDVSQTSINIVNRKTTQKIIKRYIMSYSLQAKQEGQIRLPTVAVTLGGKTYQTNPVQLDILKPGMTDKLDLEVTLSEQRCYVGQPVILTAKFYVSADIGDFQFNIPAFSSDAFFIEDPDVSNQQVKQFRLSTGMTVFASQSRVVHKNQDSILLSFSKVLIPKYSGKIEIGKSSVSANVVVGRARPRDSAFGDFGFFGSRKQYKRFMVSSPSKTLTVLALPEEAKPAGFYGLVGRYMISASATPTKVNVGDPITLTIKIGGSEYLTSVQWPALEQIPELAMNFKIPSQKSSPAIQNGLKVFTQTIRANNDKIAAIPPIPLAYFDSDKGEYVIAKTEPIKLDVEPTKILTNADVEGRDFVPVNKEVEAIKKGLSANYEGPDVLRNMSFSPLGAAVNPHYVFLWAVPLLGLISSSLIKLFMQTSPEKAALKRKRSAPGKALRQLKKITSAAPQQRQELLASIMKQYIGERFDRTAGSLTADDCHKAIVTGTQDMQISDKYRDIITECEAARYAAMDADVDTAQIKEVVRLVRNIEKKSKK
ncbi:MAG: BatD family protein [Planctomycetota bacterium]|jgi:hypothetical protein